MLSLLEFARSHYHTPAWRAQLADNLHSGELSDSRANDAEMDWPVRCLREMLRVDAGESSLLTEGHLRDYRIAKRLRYDNKFRLLRLEVECRLLDGQSIDQISEVTMLPLPVVEAYELSYFDIRDRLAAFFWIRAFVLEPESESIEHDQDCSLRDIAYFDGFADYEPMMLALRCSNLKPDDPMRCHLIELLTSSHELRSLLTSRQPAADLTFRILDRFSISPEDLNIPRSPSPATHG